MVKENAIKKKTSNQTIFYDDNAIKSEINNKKITEITIPRKF